MIDTHCHLWFPQFKNEVPQVIERAKAAGVHTLICVGCDEESSRQSVEIAGQYEKVYAAVGVHPTEVKGEKDCKERKDCKEKFINPYTLYGPYGHCIWLPTLIRSSKKIVAIGETGLDYYHQPFDRDVQISAFREQSEIAQEFDLPVLVHLRSAKESKAFSKDLLLAEKDCLEVLHTVGMKPGKVLFHCFSGDRTMAEEVLKRGWYLSFSGVITYPNAKELREVVKMCPLDRMVVETDSPFLAPQAHRGKTNEPSFVVETARQIAELKGIRYEELEQILDHNVVNLFLHKISGFSCPGL